jgi:spore germination protein
LTIHVVRQGDSLYSIGQLYGVPWSQIASDNGLENSERLVVGQALVVPTSDLRHTVSPGESLYSIGRRYRVSLGQILAANPDIANPGRILPGQALTIPRGIQKLGAIEVNGFAFPNIGQEVLQKTLPYLTYLSIFSYQARPDGSLAPINDAPLIQAARKAGVAPLMVITNIAEGASFDSDLAHTLLTDTAVQDALVRNVQRILEDKNYFGLDIDFEYIYPEDREAYTRFVRRMSEALRPKGYILSTSLAPKTSAAQRGLLYEAHDYAAQAALLDHIILMTYEWGYTYGPPMAVSPIGPVRQVLQYAVTVIPPEKILMGMPNYGYDWTLPFVRGSAARTLTNPGAVEQAYEKKAAIQYDRTSQAPFFSYYDADGRRHMVWFEDARSVEARLRLVHELGLGGVSYWTVNRFFPQNWAVLSAMYDVKKVL